MNIIFIFLYIINSFRIKPHIKSETESGNKYLHGKNTLPIYYQSAKLLTTQELMNVLLDCDLKSDLICSQVPFSVSINCVFVVNLSKLETPKDILCDDMGTWTWNGSFRKWCSITEDGYVKQLGKVLPTKDRSSNVYRVWKRYYFLKCSPDVRKMFALLEGEVFSGVKERNIELQLTNFNCVIIFVGIILAQTCVLEP